MTRGVNLVPTARLEARQRRLAIRHAAIGCGAYALALCLGWAALHLAWGGAGGVLDEQIRRHERQIQEARAAAAELEPRLAEARTTLAASRSVSGQPDWSIVLDLLANQLGPDVALSSVVLLPREEGRPGVTGYELRLAGLGRSIPSVSGFVMRLEQTGLFDRLMIRDTEKRTVRDGSAVAFRAEATLGFAAQEGSP